MSTTESTGQILAGRYRLHDVIGRGGMATVYRATDDALGRLVAVKLLNSEFTGPEQIKRQNDEVRLIASLSHPALVTLFDAVVDETGANAECFLVMQLVDGPDLRHRLQAGPLPPALVARLGADLASGLAYLATLNVVHRDVKPANVLIVGEQTPAPRALLADFGIARIVDAGRHTTDGSVMGTASYLSPEQALGEDIAPASDVYSLGLVLIEALTGVRSFPGSPAESVSARLSADPPIPQEFGPEWSELLAAMTRREPAERISAFDASDALAALAIGLPRTEALVDAYDQSPTLRLDPVTAPTELIGASRTQPTTRLGAPAALPPQARPVSQRPPRVGATRPARQRPVWFTQALLAVVGVLIIAGGAWAITQSFAPHPITPPAYPPVEGDLGIHLEQLQRSVEP